MNAMAEQQPTGQQALILRTIEHLSAENEYPPSVRQIAKAMGLSPSVAHGHMTRLRAKGLLAWEPEQPRTLRLTDDGRKKVSAG